jgi:hypothetical protein
MICNSKLNHSEPVLGVLIFEGGGGARSLYSGREQIPRLSGAHRKNIAP